MFRTFLIAWLVVLALGLPLGVLAADLMIPSNIPTDEPAPAGEVNPGCPAGRQCLQNPLAPVGKEKYGPTDVTVIIGTIIKGALGILGSIALYAFVKGGAKWLMSFGNPEKVKEGAMTMLYAALGLLVVLASYFLLSQYFAILTSNPKIF